MSEIDGGSELRELFRRQGDLLTTLSHRAKELRSSKDPRPKKIDKLRALIADSKNGLSRFDPPLPLPLDARVRVTGIVADKSTVFKSNLFPLRLQFTREVESEPSSSQSGQGSSPRGSLTGLDDPSPTEDGAGGSSSTSAVPSDYAVIFKNGDDLRQDQLVIQLFTLMDRLLRNEKLDLRMTPYRVLATGAVDGMVQFVESMSIAGIMAAYGGSLLNYMRHHHPDEASPSTYGVEPAVLDTFVRSCGECLSRLGRERETHTTESWRGSVFPCDSRLLCGHLSTWRWRSASGQPPPRPGRALLPRYVSQPVSPCPLSQLTPFPSSLLRSSRLRLHPRPRSQAVPTAGQSVQRDGRRDGRYLFCALCPLPFALLHGFHEFAQEREFDIELGGADGRCQRAGYQSRAR